MVDGVILSLGTADGAKIATDDQGASGHVQYNKLMFGGDGTFTIVSTAAGLPVQAASGAIASGAVASGAIASGAVASGAFASGALASGAISDGANVTLGAKADAKSTATDTTAITIMSVLKQISASVQAPPSQAVTNAGTFVTQENGALLTSSQLIDDMIYTDDTSTHATGTSKGALMMAAATPTDAAVDANDIGALAMTLARELKVSVTTALVAGTNNIGDVDVLTVPADPFGANADAGSATGSISAKLRFIASTGIPITGTVTVGSHAVTVASGGIASGAIASGAVASGAVASGAYASGALAAGSIATGAIADMLVDDAAFTPATSRVMPAGFEADETATDSVDEGDIGAGRMTLDRKQIVTPQPHTAGGVSTFMASGSDGSSILVATKQTISAAAAQLYGFHIYNPEAAVTFVHFYNTDTVTVGTTNPLITIPVLAGGAVICPPSAMGVPFSTAISCAATTTAGGNTAPSTGASLVAWYK